MQSNLFFCFGFFVFQRQKCKVWPLVIMCCPTLSWSRTANFEFQLPEEFSRLKIIQFYERDLLSSAKLWIFFLKVWWNCNCNTNYVCKKGGALRMYRRTKVFLHASIQAMRCRSVSEGVWRRSFCHQSVFEIMFEQSWGKNYRLNIRGEETKTHEGFEL